ncbi:MAG: hypothetical protein OER88_04190, partial [Planctomycetota bacterium]|nr:hypothetical protein [Planctomycetota bacterium]
MRLHMCWVALALIAALVVPFGCGGGGGGGGPVVLALNSLSVTSQPGGSAIPFGNMNGGDTVVL